MIQTYAQLKSNSDASRGGGHEKLKNLNIQLLSFFSTDFELRSKCHQEYVDTCQYVLFCS